MLKLLIFFTLFTFYISNSYSQNSILRFEIPSEIRQLKMPWRNCIAVGRAQNLLRADLQEQMIYAQKIMGYRYCRFHAIFDDELNVVNRMISCSKLESGLLLN